MKNECSKSIELHLFTICDAGVALGVIATLMHHIPDDVFLIAARELAASVRDEDLEVGSLYPPLDAIREVSLRIAIGITKYAYCEGMSPFFEQHCSFFCSKILHRQLWRDR